MNAYIFYLYKTYGYGAFDEDVAVVIANTEKEALGMLLQEQGYRAEDWELQGSQPCSMSGVVFHQHRED